MVAEAQQWRQRRGLSVPDGNGCPAPAGVRPGTSASATHMESMPSPARLHPIDVLRRFRAKSGRWASRRLPRLSTICRNRRNQLPLGPDGYSLTVQKPEGMARMVDVVMRHRAASAIGVRSSTRLDVESVRFLGINTQNRRTGSCSRTRRGVGAKGPTSSGRKACEVERHARRKCPAVKTATTPGSQCGNIGMGRGNSLPDLNPVRNDAKAA